MVLAEWGLHVNLFSEELPAGLVPILSTENTVRYTLLKLQFIGTLSYTLPEFLLDCSAPLSVILALHCQKLYSI